MNTAVPANPDLTGQTLGAYRLLKRLGRSGPADLYLAEADPPGQPVAIRLIGPRPAADPGGLLNFGRLAKASAALRHAHILPVLDFGIEAGQAFLVTEHRPGGTLDALLQVLGRRGQLLPVSQAVRIGREIALALAEAHGQGVIHGDLTAAAVLLDPAGRALVADFGVAAMAGSQPAHRPPEPAAGPAADLYALGVIVFQMIAGRLPAEAGPTAPAAPLRPDLPAGLEPLVLQSLAADPGERFPTAEAFIAALSPFDTPQASPTLGRVLGQIACGRCGQAALEAGPDGAVRCLACGQANAMPGPVCPHCATVNAAGAEACSACSRPLARTCPDCRGENWSGAEHCRHCGRPLDTLSTLIDRAGDAGERFHQARRELAAVSAQESEGARQRLEHLEAIDERRRLALQAARQRKAREQRSLLLLAAGLIVILAAGLAVVALLFWR